MRGRPTRHWVKLYCDGCLHGSINYQLTLEEQAVWFKLIMLSAVRCQTPGTISDNDGNPLPPDFIAHELHCTPDLLLVVVKKCVEEGRLENNHTGLRIINFEHYQSTEYDRQKPYREAKKAKLVEELREQQQVSFDVYVEEMTTKYPLLNVKTELEKFKLYWSEGKKELKRPKSAFKNWLEKAVAIKIERDGASNKAKVAKSSGRYGDMVKGGEDTQPNV